MRNEFRFKGLIFLWVVRILVGVRFFFVWFRKNMVILKVIIFFLFFI